jgi:hypothetical protein
MPSLPIARSSPQANQQIRALAPAFGIQIMGASPL